MNIFVIPSWYPNPDQPVLGIFVYDQVSALAEMYPDARFFVSAVHPFTLPLEHLPETIRILNRYRKYPAQTLVQQNTKNMWTFLTPCLEWTPKLMNGNLRKRYKIHFSHFEAVLSRFGPVDLIHAHVCYPAGYTSMRISRKMKIPYIVTEHMSPFPFQRPYFLDRKGNLTGKVRLPLLKAARTIAVSHGLSASISKYGLPEPEIIPNLVDEDRFYPRPKQADGVFHFLSFSSMVHQKGFDILIRAISLASKNDKNIHFTLAGTGPEKESCRKLAETLGCDDAITWLGQKERKDVPELFNGCDAFILPSRHESFGIVCIEAMACGKPVIATRCGGPEYYVYDENGILIPVNDPQAAAKAILDMKNQISRFDSGKIRNFFMDHFSKRIVTEKIMKIYNEATHSGLT